MNLDKTLATLTLREQIVAKNTPKQTPDRDQVIRDTLAFFTKTFGAENIKPEDIKKITLLRVENGNRDLNVVELTQLPTADLLANAFEAHPCFNDRFLLKEGESVQMEPDPEPHIASLA